MPTPQNTSLARKYRPESTGTAPPVAVRNDTVVPAGIENVFVAVSDSQVIVRAVAWGL